MEATTTKEQHETVQGRLVRVQLQEIHHTAGFDVQRRTRSASVSVHNVQRWSWAYAQGVRDGDSLMIVQNELAVNVPISVLREKLKQERPLVCEILIKDRQESSSSKHWRHQEHNDGEQISIDVQNKRQRRMQGIPPAAPSNGSSYGGKEEEATTQGTRPACTFP